MADRLVEQVPVPESAEDTYRSVLFAVKNLTVIPFTVIWMVSVARTCVQYDLAEAAAASR